MMDFSDPQIQMYLLVAAGLLIALILLMLRSVLRQSSGASQQMVMLAQRVDQLSSGQDQLGGSLTTVVQNQAQGQNQITNLMEQRLGEVQLNLHENLSKVQRRTGENLATMQQQMSDNLATQQLKMQENMANMQMRTNQSLAELQEKLNQSLMGNAKQTATSLTQLQERLATIDKAQENITKLSGDVLSLQDILSNKQTRGAFYCWQGAAK